MRGAWLFQRSRSSLPPRLEGPPFAILVMEQGVRLGKVGDLKIGSVPTRRLSPADPGVPSHTEPPRPRSRHGGPVGSPRRRWKCPRTRGQGGTTDEADELGTSLAMQGNRGGGGQGSVSSAIRFGPLFLRSGAAATPKSVETLGGSTAKQPQRVPFRQRVASPAKVLKLPHAFAAESSCSPRLLDDRCVATREFETLAAKATEDVHRLTLGRKLKPRARHGAIKRRQPCAIKRRIWECPLVESEQPAAGLAPAWLPASPAHT